jgi:cytochrome c oxidase subunit 2
MAAMLSDESAIRNVTAYIGTLEPSKPDSTISGDPQRGASFYNTCGACHGALAQGNYALQAPSLAGQDDWYLKRQLENFRLGVRGAHKGDTYGHQMVLMARSVQNEQSIDDLLAYLNTL